ncbi:hypothetical protein CPC08DRAFT_732375 [Agrocybe pediades]|nr:hypothetical protein CPC08DRAFT_732375 [Agrocybe pediades]
MPDGGYVARMMVKVKRRSANAVDLTGQAHRRLTFFLPNPVGRFQVGVTTFTTPVRPAKVIGSAKFRKDNKAALCLQEVAFTAYYPADVDSKSKKGAPWFIRPVKAYMQGFAAFLGIPSWILWPIVYLFGAFLKVMPAYPGAPLLNPANCPKDDKEPISRWPLVIFSHGLGGSRTAYSQFCSNLAASGKVVLAIEHRDGTGVMTMPRSWDGENKVQTKSVFYYREGDICDVAATGHPLPLRGQQLAFRHHEVNITYTTLCRLVRKDPSLEIDTQDCKSYDFASWTARNSVGEEIIRHNERVALAGHSFGGCTILSLLSTPPLEGYRRIPLDKTIILDPWLDPLPSPGPFPVRHDIKTEERASSETEVASEMDAALPGNDLNPKSEGGSHPEMLVINSEAFTLWKDHYARLKEVIAGWHPQGGRIMTIVGSEHISFSDFPVLPTFFQKSTARPIAEIINKLSSSFLTNRLEETLSTLPTTNMDVITVGKKKDKYGSPKRKLAGDPGDIITEPL